MVAFILSFLIEACDYVNNSCCLTIDGYLLKVDIKTQKLTVLLWIVVQMRIFEIRRI